VKNTSKIGEYNSLNFTCVFLGGIYMKKKILILITFLILCIITFGISYGISYKYFKGLPQIEQKHKIVVPTP
jgi:hypothetical protein